MYEWMHFWIKEEHRFCLLIPIYRQEPKASNVRDGQCETCTGAKTGGKVPELSHRNKQTAWLGCFQGLIADILRHVKTYLRMLRLPFPKSIPASNPCQTSFSEAHVKLGNREFHEIKELEENTLQSRWSGLKFNWGLRWREWGSSQGWSSGVEHTPTVCVKPPLPLLTPTLPPQIHSPLLFPVDLIEV